MIDERARHDLHAKLEQVLGADEADTLMAHLPPVGWADVATKSDLDHAVHVLRLEMQSMRQELLGKHHELRGEFATQTRQLVLTLVPVIAAINGAFVAVAAALG